jgi:hypothetical protein
VFARQRRAASEAALADPNAGQTKPVRLSASHQPGDGCHQLIGHLGLALGVGTHDAVVHVALDATKAVDQGASFVAL